MKNKIATSLLFDMDLSFIITIDICNSSVKCRKDLGFTAQCPLEIMGSSL